MWPFVSGFFHLTSFLKVHPCHSMYQHFTPFCYQMCHGLDTAHSLTHSSADGQLDYFFLALTNYAAMSVYTFFI